MLGVRILLHALSFVQLIVLARLLRPQDFGLFGVATIVVDALQSLTGLEFSSALIQKSGRIDDHLNTVWTIQVARGLVVAVAMVTCAPFAARFFNAPQAIAILSVMALGPVLGGFSNIGCVFFRRELAFQKEFLLQAGAGLGALAVSIPCALVFRNAWALVAWSVSKALFRLLASYVLHPWRPRLEFRWERARELLPFAGRAMAANVMNVVILQADSALIGRLLGTQLLGFYRMAQRVSKSVATEIASLLGTVTFPGYARLQDDRDALRATWLRTVNGVTLVTAPFSAGLIVVAPELVTHVLGAQWYTIVPLLRVLAVFAFIITLGNFSPLFCSLGEMRTFVRLRAARMLVVLALMYPLVKQLGAMGAALATLAGILVPLPWATATALRLLECRFTVFLRAILPGMTGALLMALTVYAARRGSPATTWPGFAGLVVLGIVVYSAIIALFRRMRMGHRAGKSPR